MIEEFIRINKYISSTGFCSRREADRFIENGKVLVNGKKAKIGTKVGTYDSVSVNGKVISIKKEKVYLAFNKPIGVTSTTDKKDKDNIIDYIKYKQRIFPIGRLDKDSEGLILLTNDGDIVNKILRAGNEHEKEYIITVDKAITPKFIKEMGSGVKILKTKTKPCKIEKKDKYIFKITLTQGLNRQIRRMCEKLGYQVLKLVRIRIMNIQLKGIKQGSFRYLTKTEISKINKAIAFSSKTEEASKYNK